VIAGRTDGGLVEDAPVDSKCDRRLLDFLPISGKAFGQTGVAVALARPTQKEVANACCDLFGYAIAVEVEHLTTVEDHRKSRHDLLAADGADIVWLAHWLSRVLCGQ
jgi:hypothetical protein